MSTGIRTRTRSTVAESLALVSGWLMQCSARSLFNARHAKRPALDQEFILWESSASDDVVEGEGCEYMS